MRRWYSPSRPRLWLSTSLLLGALWILTGCAGLQPEPTFRSEPAVQRAHARPRTQHPARVRSEAKRKMALVIRRFLGAPYVWGGTSPQGVDCSGLVVAVFGETFGMDLPHSAAALFRLGSPVSRRALRFGDLVFFTTRGGPTPEHVGIYLDKGMFVHASSSQGVIVERLDRSYYRRHWAGARRLVAF